MQPCRTPVWLAARDGLRLHGYVYRGDTLPIVGDVIELESDDDRRRARVTRVVEDAEMPIRASEVDE